MTKMSLSQSLDQQITTSRGGTIQEFLRGVMAEIQIPQPDDNSLHDFRAPGLVKTPDTDKTIHFAEVLSDAISSIRHIIDGLHTYGQVIQNDGDLTPELMHCKINREKRVCGVLEMKLRRLRSIQKAVTKHTDGNGEALVFADESSDLWDAEIEYVSKARSYMISTHVFYKINYALCKAPEEMDIAQAASSFTHAGISTGTAPSTTPLRSNFTSPLMHRLERCVSSPTKSE